MYRLDHLSEVVDLGLVEQLEDRSVACVEWGDLAEPAMPADFLEVRLERGAGDDDRSLSFRTVGAGWSGRIEALTGALSPWAVQR